MIINKNDFVEIEFTGKITSTDEIFDTNIEADAKKANLNIKNIRPFILSVGHKMLPSGFDNDLIKKETGKSYTINIKPENAFGKRDSQIIKMIPTKLFHEQKIDPVRGMQITLDGQLVKILSSDRGRTLVDFNNPLAGKKITYTYKINKIVTDQNEKIDALQEFFFKKIFDFDIKEKTITFKIEKQFEPFIKIIAPKFEEILGLKIESEIIEKDKKPKKQLSTQSQ